MQAIDIDKLKARDTETLKYLYNIIKPYLKSFIKDEIKLETILEFEDILQEILLVIYNNLDKIIKMNDPKKIKEYCYAITRNKVVLDLLPKYQVKEKTERLYKEKESTEIDKFDIFGEEEKSQLRNAIIKYISKLPDDERLIIQLYYYDEKTVAEIAEILGIHVSTVSRKHTRLLLKLKDYIKNQFAI